MEIIVSEWHDSKNSKINSIIRHLLHNLSPDAKKPIMPKLQRKRLYNFRSSDGNIESSEFESQTRTRKQETPFKSVPKGLADTQPGIVFTLPHYTTSEYRGKLVRIISSPPNTNDTSPNMIALETVSNIMQSFQDLSNS